MNALFVALMVVLVLGGALAIYQRYRCKRKSLPWPHYLAFFLENPYMVAFCNKSKLAQGLYELSQAKLAESHCEKPKPAQAFTALDLGCGAGRVLVPFAKLCPEHVQITAMDMQPKMLAKARRACARAGVENVSFRQLTLHPPYAEPLGSFDLIYLVTVLGEIPRLADVLFLLYRSLAFEGKLSITETLPDPCYISARRLQEAGKAAGLSLLSIHHGLMSYTIVFAKPAVAAKNADQTKEIGLYARP